MWMMGSFWYHIPFGLIRTTGREPPFWLCVGVPSVGVGWSLRSTGMSLGSAASFSGLERKKPFHSKYFHLLFLPDNLHNVFINGELLNDLVIRAFRQPSHTPCTETVMSWVYAFFIKSGSFEAIKPEVPSQSLCLAWFQVVVTWNCIGSLTIWLW